MKKKNIVVNKETWRKLKLLSLENEKKIGDYNKRIITEICYLKIEAKIK